MTTIAIIAFLMPPVIATMRRAIIVKKRTYDGERAEKARQRFEVKIADILIIQRHDKGGEHRRRKCHRKHNVILKKIRYSF